MKKIATITFHGAHNYGSNLQAYALQEYIKKIFADYNQPMKYSILNLRTKTQLEIYSIFKPNNNLKNIIENIMVLPYLKQIKNKQLKFEYFINNILEITNTQFYNEADLDKATLTYDYFISGSDQVWNIRAKDFDWANLLGFVRCGKKISYAASFGPLNINWDLYDKKRFSNLLNEYKSLSVREVGSYNQVKTLTGKESEIHVDPTLLLSNSDWIKIIGNKRIVKEKYIFFYSLEPSKKDIELVKSISKELGLAVVISKYCNKNDYFNSFIKKYDCGPIDFLNLIKNADLVLSTSFHGTVFPVIFNVPFYAINGLEDRRIGNLLSMIELEVRSIDYSNWQNNIDQAFDINFINANRKIELERNRSRRYLEEALEV